MNRNAIPHVVLAVLALHPIGCVFDRGGDDQVTPDAVARADARTEPAPDAGPRPPDASPDADLSPDASGPYPLVAFRAPADGAVIDHHGDLRLDVIATGAQLATIEVAIDGRLSTAARSIAPALPGDGDCAAGCPLTVIWNADEATEGEHVIEVVAVDSFGRPGSGTVRLQFEDTPTVTLLSPTAADQRGVGNLTVSAWVVDRGPIHGALVVDGGSLLTSASDCRYGCTVTWHWNTAAAAAGEHLVTAIVGDSAGHSATVSTAVTLGDVAMSTAIEVTNLVDEWGLLEVELHLEDATTGEWLGCAGQSQGKEGVDYSDRAYAITASFVDGAGQPLGVEQLAGRTLRVRAIEDDELPCPGPITANDDFIGLSPPFAGSDLASASRRFGNVLDLRLSGGRPGVN